MLVIQPYHPARMAELADATDSKSVSPWESGSSTLPPGTKGHRGYCQSPVAGCTIFFNFNDKEDFYLTGTAYLTIFESP